MKPKIKALARSAWIPKTKKGDGLSTDSKFCGAPYLPPGESWPCCGNCDEPMQLFVQLNSKGLPEKIPPGIYQLFYCVSEEPHCEIDDDSWDPGSDVAKLIRRLDHPKKAPPAPRIPANVKYPAKTIVGWKEEKDYPNGEELEELGIEVSEADDRELERLDVPRSKDKLRGWPHWIQSVEYAVCGDCDATMTLLFQIDSEDNVPYMFGDAGCGHITQCPNHPGSLGFGWACC